MASRYSRFVSLLLLPTLLAGCDMEARDPSSIQVEPSYAVRYATERISPAVVQLDVVSTNFQGGQSKPVQSLGSGFIVDEKGLVLTNFHVAGLALQIKATLSNQERVTATLVGSDHWTDLALVQLNMDEVRQKHFKIQVATLGDSSRVKLAQEVMAVGTPYGLSRTVTKGIVSQTDRSFRETTMEGGYETGWFNNWIQTDAAINPGNSGGPLINLRGEVIGINTRGIGEGNNLGFAIPIDTAKELIPELMTGKKIVRSYTGLIFQPLQDLEKHYEVDNTSGVLISSVEKASPAEQAGVQSEDILLAVNGKSVSARFPEQFAAVRKLIADFPVNTKLELTIRRTGNTTATTGPSIAKGEVRTLTVTTEKLESSVTPEVAINAWGMTVRDLTRAYLRDARMLDARQPRIEGVLVLTLRGGMPAQAATLEAYDIIQAVNGRKVTSVEELQAAVAEWEKSPKLISVDIRRGPRAQMTLSLKP